MKLDPQPRLSGEYRQFKYGGAIIEVPVEYTEQQINDSLAAFRQTPEFDALVDKISGAPAGIRAKVNSANTYEDRLNTLRQYYPDAIPYGDDNFVYEDETGTFRLFDETQGGLFGSGFTLTDLADLAQETVQFAGGTAGAIIGLPGGLAGSAAGAAAGTAAADYGYDLFARTFLDVEDTRSAGEAFVDRAILAGTAGLAEVGGQLVAPYIARGVQRVLGGGTQRSKAIFDAMQRQGITPTAGAVTRGRGAGRVESFLDAAAPSATIMRDQIEKVIKETEEAVEAVAARLGRRMTQQETGERIQIAADRAFASFKTKVRIMEDAIEKEVARLDPDAVLPITSLTNLRNEFAAIVARSPNVMGKVYNPFLREMDDIIAEAATYGGALPYNTARWARTNFRQIADDFNTDVRLRGVYDRIYASMTDDLQEGLRLIDPTNNLTRQFDEARRFNFSWRQENEKMLMKIINTDAPERVYRNMVSSIRDGGTMVRRLKAEFTDDEWKEISSTVLRKMGVRSFSGSEASEFSISTFLTNWRNVSDEAKAAFFGNDQGLREGLDSLVNVIDALAQSQRLGNFSNTAGAVRALDDLAAFGIDISNLAVSGITNNPAGIAQASKSFVANTVGRFLMPRTVAKLMTNAEFVRWLATPITGRSQIGGRFAQLYAIAERNPDIAEEIMQYLDVLKANDESKQQ